MLLHICQFRSWSVAFFLAFFPRIQLINFKRYICHIQAKEFDYNVAHFDLFPVSTTGLCIINHFEHGMLTELIVIIKNNIDINQNFISTMILITPTLTIINPPCLRVSVLKIISINLKSIVLMILKIIMNQSNKSSVQESIILSIQLNFHTRIIVQFF